MGVANEKKLTKAEFITRETLDWISGQAKQSSRLRKNYNFHTSDGDVCHRLLNAMEPDSYIQPHRHLDSNKDETLVVIRGKMGVIMFNSDGAVAERVSLEPTGNIMMVNLPHGKFHTMISLEEGSVFFEAKAGPFVPLTRDERAPWAPEEGAESSSAYLASLKQLFELSR